MDNKQIIKIFFGVDSFLIFLVIIFQFLSVYVMTGFSVAEHIVELIFICSLTLVMILFTMEYPAKKSITIPAAIFPIVNYIIHYSLDTIPIATSRTFLIIKATKMVFYGLALTFFNLALKKIDDNMGNPIIYVYAWIRAFLYILANIVLGNNTINAVNSMLDASWWLRVLLLVPVGIIFYLHIGKVDKLPKETTKPFTPTKPTPIPVQTFTGPSVQPSRPTYRPVQPTQPHPVKVDIPPPRQQSKPQPKQQSTQPAGKFRVCPICGHIPGPNDKFCSNCSQEL